MHLLSVEDKVAKNAITINLASCFNCFFNNVIGSDDCTGDLTGDGHLIDLKG